MQVKRLGNYLIDGVNKFISLRLFSSNDVVHRIQKKKKKQCKMPCQKSLVFTLGSAFASYCHSLSI